MLKNYFVTAFRNFRTNKLFSLINVLGLAIGISACLVIYLIVHYDLSFDRFEKDKDRIYRVVSDYSFQGNDGHTRGVQAPLIDAVKFGIPGLEEVVAFRYFNVEKLIVPGKTSSETKPFKNQSGVVFGDGDYFNMLPYQWLAGSPSAALTGARNVVLTETRAKLYFPSMSYSDMIGRRIIYADSLSCTVSGIVGDLDSLDKTDFNFREFISLATVLDNPNLRKSFHWDNWGSCTSDQQLYLKLRADAKPALVKAGLNKILDKYQGKSEKENHFTWTYNLQPLGDIHFNSIYGVFNGNLASKPALNGLLLVAFFLLFLGCINFINLTTAHASQRAREIGIRKTLGGSKKQLVIQFLSETFMVTLLATLLSLLLAPVLLKTFSGFIPEGLHFSVDSLFRQPELLMFLLLLIITVTVFAGFYPALVLSSWRPVQVLKNQASTQSGKGRKLLVRQVLTVSQFVIAQAFIMGTLLVSRQISFLLDKDLGFKKEAILSFDAPRADTSYAHRLFLLHEIQKIPGVSLTSLASDVPASGGTWATSMAYKDGKKELNTDVERKSGDSNYLKLFHIPLLAGRMLLPSDTTKELLINATYMHILGFNKPSDALGKILNWNDKNTPIVGVIQDFHTHPLNIEVKPTAFSFDQQDCRQLIVALHPKTAEGNEWKKTIASIEAAYKKAYPEEEFSYGFLDENIKGFYDGEQRISGLLKWATSLTVFISCLGLLGLVIYTTNQRTKEIGVRKVLGASVAHIVSILSADFLKLVCLGFVLATPVAWWAVHKWLEGFAFRTTIGWWVFVLSGLVMLLIAFVTLSLQIIRAAMANPIDSLRTE